MKNDSPMKSLRSSSELLEMYEVDLPQSPFVASEGEDYQIVLLHLTTGVLIIGFAIHEDKDSVWILRPMSVEPDFDENNNIVQYELVPYLDQFADAHPMTLMGTRFYKSAITSACLPSQHLIRTYNTIIHFKEQVAADPEGSLYKPTPASDSHVLH